MSLRRAGLLALPLALAACTEVTQQPQQADIVFAAFASPNIPTPNDLALAGMVTRLPTVNACGTPVDLCATPPNAQVELLCSFRAAGGFPSDMESPISIPFSAKHWNPTGGTGTYAGMGGYEPAAAPAIDLATVTAETVSVFRIDGATPVAYVMGVDIEAAASTAGDCTSGTCKPGTLTIRKKADATGSRRWPAGARITYAIRGGPNGIKAVGGAQIEADSAVALTIPNRDLTKKENQPLGAVPDSTPAGACIAGTNQDEIKLLEGVRLALWQPVPWCYMPAIPAAYAALLTAGWNPVVDPALAALCAKTPAAASATVYGGITAFPLEETASAGAFSVAPSAGTSVAIDSGSGAVPLPFDLIRTDADETIVFNPAFGAAATGLGTLDGFSTTGMMLAQTSGPVRAATVTGANVMVFKLNAAETPATLVRDLAGALAGGAPSAAAYVTQPSALKSACNDAGGNAISGGCSVAIGLQPGVTAPVPGVGTFFLPPLEEKTSYAVVITKRVLAADATASGSPLVRSTISKVLLEFARDFVVGGKSAVPGVSDDTAKGLQAMRTQLADVWTALPAGTTKDDVATAYTFRTQSITEVPLKLTAAPFSIEQAAGATFTTIAAPTAVTAPAGYPTTNVGGFYDVVFNGLDGIDKATGAFRPTLAADLANPAVLPSLIAPLHALVSVPSASVVATLPLCPGSTTIRCAKLVVFGHGLNGSKETLFTNAATLASAGFVAAAIDFPLHGGRNWCGADADCALTSGGGDGTCDKAGAFAGSATQGDAVRPGVCATGSVPKAASSRYFVSANFFRTRDALRQNLIDVSTLALALARPPSPLAPQPAQNPFASLLATGGLAIDPSQVFYEGISLGGIAGTSVMATNPRVTRGVLSVGGGTMVDVFTNSPSFQAPVDALFATLIPGYSRAAITPGDPAFDPAVAASYLKTLNVAKWILDPGDPINFAAYPVRSPLPNLLDGTGGTTDQVVKAVFAQVAQGDTVVPNAFNFLLDNLLGAHTTIYTDDDPAGGAAPHSMLGSNAVVQSDAAGFLVDPTNTANYPATRALAFP